MKSWGAMQYAVLKQDMVFFGYHVKHGTLHPCDHGLWDYEIWEHGNFGPCDHIAKGKTFEFKKTLLGQFVVH